MLNLFSDLERTLASMNGLPSRAFRGYDQAPNTPVRVSPRSSLYDTGTALIVTADVPGLGENDVKVELVEDVLTISGERKLESPDGHVVLHQEQRSWNFARSFTLPTRVDATAITASIKNGVLRVTLPKVPESRPRQIAVKAA